MTTNPYARATYRTPYTTILNELTAQGVKGNVARDKAHWAAVYGQGMAEGTWKFGPPKYDKEGLWARAVEIARGVS